MQFYRLLEGAPELAAESALRAEFRNGSRIISLPGTERTVRGYSAASLVVIDEASRVEDALLTAIKPTLATTDGRIVALSTPAGRTGWLYELWTNNDPAWDRVQVAATDCPRVSAGLRCWRVFIEASGNIDSEYTFTQQTATIILIVICICQELFLMDF